MNSCGGSSTPEEQTGAIIRGGGGGPAIALPSGVLDVEYCRQITWLFGNRPGHILFKLRDSVVKNWSRHPVTFGSRLEL